MSGQPSPYVSVPEVAVLIRVDHTKHPTLNAWRFIKRNGIASVGNGRLRVLRTSVIEALEDERKKRKARYAARRRAS